METMAAMMRHSHANCWLMQSRRGVELLGLVLRRADPSFITLGLWGALQQLEGAIGDYPDPELRRSVYLHLFLEVRAAKAFGVLSFVYSIGRCRDCFLMNGVFVPCFVRCEFGGWLHMMSSTRLSQSWDVAWAIHHLPLCCRSSEQPNCS